MAKAFPDVNGWVRNKLGKWLKTVTLPHARVSAAVPAAEADDEVTELSLDERRNVRMVDKNSGSLLGIFTDLWESVALSLKGSGTYKSPTDFAATYADVDTLTLTGLRETPATEQFSAVIEKLAAGVKTPWYATEHDFDFVATGPGAGTLVVDGATFVNTSAFEVVYEGQHRAFDAITNAIQIVMLNARQQRFGDYTEPITAHDLQVADAVTGWINVKADTEIGLWIKWTTGAAGGAHDLAVTVFGNPTDAGTDEFPATTGELDAVTPKIDEYAAPLNFFEAANATLVLYWPRLKISTATRLKFKIAETVAAGNKGVLTFGYTLTNR